MSEPCDVHAHMQPFTSLEFCVQRPVVAEALAAEVTRHSRNSASLQVLCIFHIHGEHCPWLRFPI